MFSIILFIPIFTEYLETGLVLKFPTLIVAGVIATIALLMWTSGIILQVIAKKHRQNFEILMNMMDMMDKNKNNIEV